MIRNASSVSATDWIDSIDMSVSEFAYLYVAASAVKHTIRTSKVSARSSRNGSALGKSVDSKRGRRYRSPVPVLDAETEMDVILSHQSSPASTGLANAST
jgi:hypothetical protein